ncbi:MAG: HD domain-containing protein [archaeon]
MKTKYEVHTSDLVNENASPIVRFYFEFAQLKNLLRQGYVRRTVPKEQGESVADHTFGVALLGYVIANEYRFDLDAGKVIQLSLIHEMGEIYGGDMIPADNISSEEKFKIEFAGVQRVFKNFPNGKKYVQLWLEFERGQSPEACFVKKMDKLEMGLQGLLYTELGYQGLDDLMESAQKAVQGHSELENIMEEILRSE